MVKIVMKTSKTCLNMIIQDHIKVAYVITDRCKKGSVHVKEKNSKKRKNKNYINGLIIMINL